MKTVLLLALAATLSVSAQSVETIPFRVNLSSLNESPAIGGTPSTGTATVLAHLVRDASGQIISGSVDFKVNYSLTAPAVNITAMHIHRGAAGVNGGVVIDSGLAGPIADASSGVIRTQGQAPPSNATALTALRDLVANPSGFYLNLHTTRNAAGEMRGQLMPAEMLVTMAFMNAGNEVPPIAGLNATAVCSVIAIASRNAQGAPLSGEVIFDANYSGFAEGTNMTGFHIHNAPAGLNAGVVINTGLSGTVPAVAAGRNLHYEVTIDPANPTQAAAFAGIFAEPSFFYVNIHTQANPGGAVRGQLRRTDRMNFQTTLLPANELPAISLDATAPAALTLHTLRNNEGWIVAGVSIFDLNYRFPGAAQISGLHIHDGSATTNGAVILNSGLATANQPNSESGFGNIYRVSTQSTVGALSAMNLISINPNATYYNIHTTTFPAGVMRAQTAPALSVPAVSAIISGVSDPSRAAVAPQGLMTIFGSNLLSAPSSSDAFESAAPLQLNGTSVTVGGRKAAIVALSREAGFVPTDYIVAQVPVDAPTGPQPVVVTTAGGDSSSFTVPVASAAPALYFDAIGGIAFHVDDMTLIRPARPAASGEPIALLATGLGRTIPSLPTGAILPGDALSFVLPNPTVTMGGKQASVTGAGLVPGYVGFYLIVATVPDGLSGVVPVSVAQLVPGASSPSTSNAVTIQLR
ncbi:MAG: CHRD domain-containing protein [Acidobacteria bacterium]|nr:CHRD domain-containing protein [Acidobacteriota bacterium]